VRIIVAGVAEKHCLKRTTTSQAKSELTRACMKYTYPASHEQDSLTDQLLALKIARHSSCTTCDSCPGLHPDPSWEVVLDDLSAEPSLVELDQYGSDDEDGQPNYLKGCACGHDMYDHGANQPQLGRDEFLRRGRVAIRLDEILQVWAPLMYKLQLERI
jgi:histone acetyltransferase